MLDKSKLTPDQKNVLKALVQSNAEFIVINSVKYNVSALKLRPASFITDDKNPVYQYLLAKSKKTLGDAALSAEDLLGITAPVKKEAKAPTT